MTRITVRKSTVKNYEMRINRDELFRVIGIDGTKIPVYATISLVDEELDQTFGATDEIITIKWRTDESHD